MNGMTPGIVNFQLRAAVAQRTARISALLYVAWIVGSTQQSTLRFRLALVLCRHLCVELQAILHKWEEPKYFVGVRCVQHVNSRA